LGFDVIRPSVRQFEGLSLVATARKRAETERFQERGEGGHAGKAGMALTVGAAESEP
jgi:hypothetical protein